MLLNGDGDANMLYADGLDSFQKSTTYIERLKSSDTNNKDNQKFDLIVANPPYSVKHFKRGLPSLDSFDLIEFASDESGAIECLFMERTKQLLVTGEIAALILPNSILTKDSLLHLRTRQLIMEHFAIRAIVNMESKGNVFAKTGVDAVIIFIQRRGRNEYLNAAKHAASAIKQRVDTSINGHTSVIESYCSQIYKLTLPEYFNFLNYISTPVNEHLIQDQLVFTREKLFSLESKELSGLIFRAGLGTLKIRKVKGVFDCTADVMAELEATLYKELLVDFETQKIALYALNFNATTMQVTFPSDGDDLKVFLGYEVGSGKDCEGLRLYKDDSGHIISSLYSDDNSNDPSKLSYFIREHLKNTLSTNSSLIPTTLGEFISFSSSTDLLDLDSIDWYRKINSEKPQTHIAPDSFRLNQTKLEELISLEGGTRIVKRDSRGTLYPVYGGGGISFNTDSCNRKDTWVVSRFGVSASCVRFVKNDFYLLDSGLTLTPRDASVNIDFVGALLFAFQKNVFRFARGLAQKNMDVSALGKAYIPTFSIGEQSLILNELGPLDLITQESALAIFNKYIDLKLKSMVC
jgi:hypothetical protein